MFLQGRPIREITWEFLEECKAKAIDESRILDFKLKGPDTKSESDDDKRKFLEDVCGFANAGGGLMLFGVDELREEGRRTSRFGEIKGVRLPCPFSEYKTTLENIVRSGLEPVSSGIEVHPIPGPGEKQLVVAVGVEKSALAPHRLCSYGSSEFRLRNMTSTVAMDIEMVRHSFIAREGFRQQAEDDLSAALKEFASSFSVAERDRYNFALWAAIAPTYPGALALPIRSPQIRELLESFAQGRRWMPSLEVKYDHHGAMLARGRGRFGVDRVFRTGLLQRASWLRTEEHPFLKGEIPWGNRPPLEADDPGTIEPFQLREDLDRTFEYFREARSRLGIFGPAIVWVALVGMGGPRKLRAFVKLPVDPNAQRYTEADTPIPGLEPVIEKHDTSDEALRLTLKDVADGFWQAAGHQECNGIDEQGLLIEGLK